MKVLEEGDIRYKKIISALVKIKMENKKTFRNLDSRRDWGHAKDYVEAMWKILQQKKPDDFVIATGNNLVLDNL